MRRNPDRKPRWRRLVETLQDAGDAGLTTEQLISPAITSHRLSEYVRQARRNGYSIHVVQESSTSYRYTLGGAPEGKPKAKAAARECFKLAGVAHLSRTCGDFLDTQARSGEWPEVIPLVDGADPTDVTLCGRCWRGATREAS